MKTIRLTESDFYRVITESVNKVLNELDARTYASARDKAWERGETRAADFGNAAVDAWNRDYEDRDSDDNVENGRWMDRAGNVVTYSRDKTTPQNFEQAVDFYDDMKRVNYTDKNGYEMDWEYPLKDRKRLPKHFRAAREMAKGNGKYIKGKGWK